MQKQRYLLPKGGTFIAASATYVENDNFWTLDHA